jgi:PPOX class probable F420-dependent enzyme
MTTLPESHADLLERPVLAALATVEPDGTPQVTPVWILQRDNKLVVNTAAGRRKHKNLLARPQVTVLLVDPDNDQRYLEVRGKVVESFAGQQADDDIDAMAKKYLDVDAYPYRVATDTRVTFIIEPVRAVAS